MCSESCIELEENNEKNELYGRGEGKKKKGKNVKSSACVLKVRCILSAASAVFISEGLHPVCSDLSSYEASSMVNEE